MSNPNQVAGGYKATLSNPNASDEAKQHAKEMLEQGNFEGSSGGSGETDTGDKNPNNVAGGLKAAINNPNTSEEAKKDAQNRLDNM